MLTYGQKTSQDVSYMTSWDETALNSQEERHAVVGYFTTIMLSYHSIRF